MRTLLQGNLSDLNGITHTKEELERIKIPVNQVLVKLQRGNDQVTLNKGLENEQNIYIPVNTGNQEIHAPVYCEVVKVCERLQVVEGGQWETEIEIVEGDEIIVQYLHLVDGLGGYFHQGEGENKCFVCEGDTYVYISYMSIYCAVREDIIPVNGWCFGEAVKRPMGPLDLEEEDSEWQCVVKYLGKPNKRYTDLDKYGDEVFTDEAPIKVGDIVLAEDQHFLHGLEFPMHQKLNETLLCFQRQHICATLSEVIHK